MKKQWIAYPYAVWMTIFIIVPLFLILFFSITESTEAGISFTTKHFKKFVDPIYIDVLVRSVLLALYATIICLLLGYPFALILASKTFKRKSVLLKIGRASCRERV